MLKILIYFLFPICLFSNDFIWERTEIGNDLINTDKVQLASSDLLGNVVFFDKESNTLFFKSNLDTTWQIRHKKEINTEIFEVLSVFISRSKIYLLVLYEDLTQSLISSEINNNLLTDIYTKYETFDFVSDSLIKLNKIVRLNDEILISYSNKVNMTDYYVLHYFDNGKYRFKILKEDFSGDKNLYEENKTIDLYYFWSGYQFDGYYYDLVFLNKNAKYEFPVPVLNSNFNFENYSFRIQQSNQLGSYLESEILGIIKNIYLVNLNYHFEENFTLGKNYRIFMSDSIFDFETKKNIEIHGKKFISKVSARLKDGYDFNKITLVLEKNGKVLTNFIRLNNTVFFLFYNEIEKLTYTYFSNDECDSWNYFISSNIEYTGEFENIVGKDEVYLYNDDAIYSTNYNYYFSSAEKFSNINHFYSGNIVKIFSNYNIKEIKIFDLNGKEVYTNFNVNTKTQEINLEEIGHTIGVYFCLVKTKNEIKLIKLLKGI